MYSYMNYYFRFCTDDFLLKGKYAPTFPLMQQHNAVVLKGFVLQKNVKPGMRNIVNNEVARLPDMKIVEKMT